MRGDVWLRVPRGHEAAVTPRIVRVTVGAKRALPSEGLDEPHEAERDADVERVRAKCLADGRVALSGACGEDGRVKIGERGADRTEGKAHHRR